MKVSLKWAQAVSNVDISSLPKEELLKKIGEQLGAVEEVIDFGKRYDGIYVVKVVSCDPHPNADNLHVCKIDDGGKVREVERDDQDLIQVVCGAPNVTTGVTVAWLPPGSIVPSTLDKDPFVLGVRDLRGVKSNGMLASAAELGISDNHEGLLLIDEAEVGVELMTPGTEFKNLYDLDDTIIDCENKMFTHRPDCFGILGVARELAGITQQAFKSPEWYTASPVFKEANDLPLHIAVESNLVPRFMAVAMDNVVIKPSPISFQAALTRVGIRPINNVVDITNWLMHLTGQPLHAYDYDKVAKLSGTTPTVVARMAKLDEKVELLNGKVVTMDNATIAITTDTQALAVAGCMGGANSEVDANTKSIIIEVASFDMYAIRKASMKYGIFTDAVTRFNKGQSPLQNDRVLAEAMRLMHQHAGATQASKVHDIKAKSVEQMPVVSAGIDFINTRLGSSLTIEEATKLLANVECIQHQTLAQETRSYLMGVGDITDKLERAGIKIVEHTPKGDYKLILPAGTEVEFEKIVAWEMQPGFWCEYVGAKNVFLFKSLDLKMSRYELGDDTEHEIVEMCRTFANQYFTSVDAMLATNSWYKPLLPLQKTFQVEQTDSNKVTVAPPFWRRDIELAEDLVEEIGRLYGFTKLPIILPTRQSKPTKRNAHLDLLSRIRSTLSGAGANELVTYSFVHEKILKQANQKPELAYHLRNALSPDLQYYRMSLTPSLLDKVHPNIKAGYDTFALYELGRTHNKVEPVKKGDVPEEFNMLAFVYTQQDKSAQQHAYYTAKIFLDRLAQSIGLELDYEPIETMPEFPVTAPFDVSRSAYVVIKHSKIMLGIIGEYKNSVLKGFKLPSHTAGFEIGTKELLEAYTSKRPKYMPLLRYPSSQQDITLEVSQRVRCGDLTKNIEETLNLLTKEHGYLFVLEHGDSFVPEGTDKKRLSYKLRIAHSERTLTTEEANKALDEVSRRAYTTLAAARI